jgi:hypothetical protein
MRRPIPGDVRKAVQWLLVAFMVAQLIIVPWRYRNIPRIILDDSATFPYRGLYGPVWSPPTGASQIRVERLALQLAGTGALLILWLAKTKPEEPNHPTP